MGWGGANNTGAVTSEPLTTDPGVAENSFDAIVIGAGIFGCGITFELARRGLRVCAVDMNAGPGMGSTSSSGAIIRFSYSTVDGVRLAWEGNQYWERFAEYLETDEHRHGVAHKVLTGQIMLRTHEDLHQLYVRNLTEAGVPFAELTSAEVVAQHPYLTVADFGGPASPDDERFWAEPSGVIPGALFMPDCGYINDPQLAAQNLHTAAVAKGAAFCFGARVDELLLADDGASVAGVRLRAKGEKPATTIHAPIVVNVGGPWSSAVNKIAGLENSMTIQTRPMRHEAHLAPAPDGLDFEADGTIVGDLDQGMYFRPATGNNIFVGSTDPECDGHEWVEDMDNLNREVTEPIWSRQMMRVAKRVPGFGVPHTRQGLAEAYDVSTDWGPIYDRTDLDGFFVAIGTSGNQFKNACVASHLMGELITAVGNGHDHDADPLLVHGRFTGTPIDMGAFSRNRVVNADSTNSVMG